MKTLARVTSDQRERSLEHPLLDQRLDELPGNPGLVDRSLQLLGGVVCLRREAGSNRLQVGAKRANHADRSPRANRLGDAGAGEPQSHLSANGTLPVQGAVDVQNQRVDGFQFRHFVRLHEFSTRAYCKVPWEARDWVPEWPVSTNRSSKRRSKTPIAAPSRFNTSTRSIA